LIHLWFITSCELYHFLFSLSFPLEGAYRIEIGLKEEIKDPMGENAHAKNWQKPGLGIT